MNFVGQNNNIQHYFIVIVLAFIDQLNVLKDFCCDFI